MSLRVKFEGLAGVFNAPLEGADVNVKSHYGLTALGCAVWNGHIELIKLLIDKGADVMKNYVVMKQSY